MDDKLQEHLDRLGLADIEDPQAAWLALHAEIGARATLLHRYQLEAASRGVGVAELAGPDRREMQRQVLPVLFPGWQPTSDGTGTDPIIVTAYDPSWPDRFEEYRACLVESLDGLKAVVEHIGSTAVPGLAAKPVIDIMVAVPDSDDEASYVAAIERCGVQLRSKDDGHRYFRPLPPLPRTVQIHVVDLGSEWQRTHVLFRDYLRAHPGAAKAYGEMKRGLAVTFRDDRLAYNAAKTEFILDHMEKAERWRVSSS